MTETPKLKPEELDKYSQEAVNLADAISCAVGNSLKYYSLASIRDGILKIAQAAIQRCPSPELPPLPKGCRSKDNYYLFIKEDGCQFSEIYVRESKGKIVIDVIDNDNHAISELAIEVAIHLRAMLDKAIKEAKGE
ncbi:MAG: hypothetical protein AB7F19_07900 [Candidatus Babeliales bacterium]